MRELALSIALTLSLAALVVEAGSGGARRTKLARLFDYDGYKQVHGKNYSSPTEDSLRRGYFYARALEVFVAAVRYRRGQADHYLALNEMSDWTPAERAAVRNRRRAGGARGGTRPERDWQLPFIPARGQSPEEALRGFLEARRDGPEPAHRHLLDELDRFWSEPDGRGARPREVSLEALAGPRTGGKAGGPAEQVARAESNNPRYAGLELMTRGLGDQLEGVDFKVMEAPAGDSPDSRLDSSLRSLRAERRARRRAAAGLPDETFLDHRRSGCMSAVRNQGACGSCYAFAAVAIAEWLYCRRHGRLVAFSEQYMVDCGKGRLEGMDGCEGATERSVAEFIHNFGLELGRAYPYRGVEGACPYHEHTDLRTTGYIRMELGALVEVPASLWPEVLPETPLYVLIEMDEAFLDYGGGVYDGSRCRQEGAGHGDEDEGREFHAMALVGHGREAGREYWLIRNSHGPGWGERGHYKLAKDAPAGCIPGQVAYAFGSDRPRPRKNRRHAGRPE